MAENQVKLDKNKILSTIPRQNLFNNLMSGLRLEEAAKKAHLSPKYASNVATGQAPGLVVGCGINALVRQEQAKIGLKNEITVANQQLELIKDRETARAAGKSQAAIRCTELLLKTIGGLQSDRIPEANLEAKRLDTKRAEELRLALIEHNKRKYLAVEQDT